MKHLLLILVLLLSATGVVTAGDPAYEVRVTQGIVYGHGEVLSPSPDMKPLLLDLYEPTGPTVPGRRHPAILMIHGGGFVGGSRQFAAWVRMATELAMRGYVVASIDYRMRDDAPVLSERVQAMVEEGTSGFELWMTAAVDDGLTALDWLVDNSGTLSLDPPRLGVMGGSAGAITAIHLAYTVNGYGIDAPALRFVVDFWGGALIPLSDPVEAASHLETGEPPLFIVHGTEDRTVPISRSDDLVARAAEQGVPYEFHAIAGADHGFDAIDPHVVEVEPGLTVFDRMVEWIHAALPVQMEIDITWNVTGVDVDLVVCKNKTTGQKGRIDMGIPISGSCADVGLVWDPGDNVQIKAVGTVISVADAGGSVTGIAPNLLVCKNRSTELGEKVRVENPPPSWNCTKEGLALAVGERLQWKTKGPAN